MAARKISLRRPRRFQDHHNGQRQRDEQVPTAKLSLSSSSSSSSAISPSTPPSLPSPATTDFSFHDCPPAIQRKCFSSLERLRIAQQASQSASSSTSPRSTSRTNSSSSSSRRPRRRLVHSKIASSRHRQPEKPVLVQRHSSYFKTQSFRHRPRRSSSPIGRPLHVFSPTDAIWFKTLPSKIQQCQFSEDERSFLSRDHPQSPGVIPDAADLRLFELSRYLETNRSIPTLYTDLSTPCTLSPSLRSLDHAGDMDESLLHTLRALDQEDDLDLASTLEDYHRFYAPQPKQPKRSNHAPSFRKVMSLSNIPFVSNVHNEPLPRKSLNLSTSSAQSTGTPLSPARPSMSLRANSRPKAPSIRSESPSTGLEMAATHYQDPSARLKLRVYLASPQKFDEAIEFGFPSIDDAETHPLSRPSLQKRRNREILSPISGNGKTFLDDTNQSVFDALDASSDEADAQSLPERGSPYTPQEGSFHDTYLISPTVASPCSSTSSPKPKVLLPIQTKQQQNLPERGKPVIRYDASEPLAQVLAGNREMTLRMTLTRPDLRADEAEPAQKNVFDEDPLALDALPPASENNASIWDTLPPAKQSGIRKIWRKVSGKGY